MVRSTSLILVVLLAACGGTSGGPAAAPSDTADTQSVDVPALDTADAGSLPDIIPDLLADTLDTSACSGSANYCVGNKMYTCKAGQPAALGACPPGSCCSGAGVCISDTCAPDSCAPTACGTPCTCANPNSACSNGKCVCKPYCNGKVCGDDGCGAKCGTDCGAGLLCKAGACVSSVCGFDVAAALTLAQAQIATQAFISMVAAPDGGAIVTGQDANTVQVTRYGVDGKAIWQLAQADLYYSVNALPAPDGVVISSIIVDGPGTDASRGVLRRFDDAGKLQWSHTYPETLPGTFFPNWVVQLANGDLVQLGTDTIQASTIGGSVNYHGQWIRTDATGKVLSTGTASEVSAYGQATPTGDDFVALTTLPSADPKEELPKTQLRRIGAKPWTYDLANNAAAMAIVAVSQSDVVASVIDQKTGVGAGNYSLLRLDQNGAKVWQVNFGKRYLGPIVALPSGDVVLAVTDAGFFNPADHVTLARVGPDGKLVWLKDFAQVAQTEVVGQLLALGPMGHLVLLGVRQPVNFNFVDFSKVSGFLINMNADGAAGCP